MKRLLEYINEGNVESLKDSILKSIEMIDDEDILKSINKRLSIPTSRERTEIINNIKTHLSENCGIGPIVVKTLLQKIDHHGCLREMNVLIDKIQNGNNPDIQYFTSDILVHDDYKLDKDALDKKFNIYDEILKFVKSCSIDDTDQDFINLLEDISNCTIATKRINPGKFEYLTRIFLKDLLKGNKEGRTKPESDINSKKYSIEYKCPCGRISGNKNESKGENAIVITTSAIQLAVRKLTAINKKKDSDDIRDIISKISNMTDIFRKNDNILSFITHCIQGGLTSEQINHIIVDSFLKQVPNANISAKELYDKFQPVGPDNNIDTRAKNNSTVKIIMDLWLALNLYNYYNVHQFDYLLVFDNDGNYVSVNFSDVKTIDDVCDIINTYHLSSGSTRPAYSGTANDSNSYPGIYI